jgi:hypothetical protein
MTCRSTESLRRAAGPMICAGLMALVIAPRAAALSPISDGRASVSDAAVTDGTGGVVLTVWRENRGAGRRRRSELGWSERGADGRWTRPVHLLRSAAGTGELQADSGRDGTVTLAWVRRLHRGWAIEATIRSPGGAFSAPVIVGRMRSGSPTDVHLAADDAGNAVLVWSRELRDRAGGVTAAVRRGARWSPPVALASRTSGLFPDAAGAGNGVLVVTWETARRIVLIRALPSSGFSVPTIAARTTLKGPPDAAPDVCCHDVAATPDGTALVAWREVLETEQTTIAVTAASVAGPDGSVHEVLRTPSPEEANGAIVAANASGNALVAWDRDSPRAALLAASRTGDGPFDAAVQVSGAPTDPYADVGLAAMDDAGNAVLGWNGEDANTGALAIRLATWTPNAAWRVFNPLGASFASGGLVGVALAAGRGLGVAILPSGVPKLFALDADDV